MNLFCEDFGSEADFSIITQSVVSMTRNHTMLTYQFSKEFLIQNPSKIMLKQVLKYTFNSLDVVIKMTNLLYSLHDFPIILIAFYHKLLVYCHHKQFKNMSHNFYFSLIFESIRIF